jgi:hypothetical protein
VLLLRILLVSVRGSSLEQWTLTACSIFSARFGVLADDYPSHDWEALRSLIILYDVRRFFTFISVVHIISDVASSNAQTLGGLPQSDEQPTAFISTLTVPTEVLNTLTLDARVGDVARSEIGSGHGPSRTVEFAV